jgi:aconitate hydratase
MSPEYGSTCAIFPIDEETIDYLRFTGRPKSRSSWSRPTPRSRASGTTESVAEPVFSEYARARPRDVEPSLAGPKRPQDRVRCAGRARAFPRTPSDDSGTATRRRSGAKTVRGEAAARAPRRRGARARRRRRRDRAITSCTNTSNPSVMVAAGLLAKNAVERGPDGRSRG